MKKVYLLGASLIFGACAFAQLNATDYKFNSIKMKASKFQKPILDKKKVKGKVEKAAGDVIWSEDFETGSLTTSNGTWVTGGTNDTYWNVGSTHALAAFGWTSNLNGSFLQWDSYNPNSSEASFASTAVDGSVTSPTIDLSTVTNAVLNFKTESMYCCNVNEFPWGLAISVDNGTTWSDTVELDFGVDRNSATEYVEAPMNYSYNLNKFGVTFSANTKIKFVWTALNQDVNGQLNTHYWWDIDDIEIIENYNYDVSLNSMWLADIFNDYEYTDIPQSFGGELTVMATMTTLGAQAPTNLSLKVEIYDTAGTFITSATGGAFSNNFVYESDTVVFNTGIDLSSLDLNMYYAEASLTMDQTDENSSNDKVSRIFRISDFYYGQRDYDAQYRFYNNVGDANAPEYQAYELGNAMYIPTDIELHGLELPIANTTNYPTTPNTELAVKFYEYDPMGTDFQNNHIPLDPIRYFTIVDSLVPASGANTVVLNFHKAEGENGPVALTGGKYYIVAISHDGGTDNSFSTLVNNSDDDYSTHLFGDYGSTAGDRWFTYGEQFTGRLVFDASLNINENNTFANVSEVYPNPTTGEATIAYNLDNSSNVSVKVVDITGKVVYTAPAENKAAGKHNVNINAASFNSGVYYVTIATEESQVTKKLIRK